jgi:hypothetical protein
MQSWLLPRLAAEAGMLIARVGAFDPAALYPPTGRRDRLLSFAPRGALYYTLVREGTGCACAAVVWAHELHLLAPSKAPLGQNQVWGAVEEALGVERARDCLLDVRLLDKCVSGRRVLGLWLDFCVGV